MVNNSVSSIVFEWERCNSDYIILVEPLTGELGMYSVSLSLFKQRRVLPFIRCINN